MGVTRSVYRGTSLHYNRAVPQRSSTHWKGPTPARGQSHWIGGMSSVGLICEGSSVKCHRTMYSLKAWKESKSALRTTGAAETGQDVHDTPGSYVWIPVILLLLLSQFGKYESQDQHPNDDGHYAEGQRYAQRPVDRIVAELATVAQVAFAHQVAAASPRYDTGTMAVALQLSAGRQVVVDASRLGRARGGHRRKWDWGRKERKQWKIEGVEGRIG